MGRDTISCQLAFYPLETVNISQEVKVVLELIDQAPVESVANDLSTNIYGESREVFSLLQAITACMDRRGTAFTMSAHISNYCGCGS